MIEAIWNFADRASLMPHSEDSLWSDGLIYLHLFSDLAMIIAYFSLPLFLLALVRRKPEFRKGGIIPLFALFIFFCGLSHLMNVWVLWVPDYLAQGIIKLATATVSVLTAIMVWPLLPKITAMPSTEQLMKANSQLDESREFMSVVLDSVEDGIVACDEKGVLKLFNRKTQELHGLPAEPLPPEDWAKYYDLFEADGTTPMKTENIPLFRALRGEYINDVHFVVRPHAGEPKHLKVRGRSLTDGKGRKVGAIVSMHDTTRHRQEVAAREAAETALRRSQRMEAVGQLTGGIAHDFNNLLGIILGNTEFLGRLVGDNKQAAKRIANVRRATTRGSQLTRQLLNFSSQDAHPGTPTNANDVLTGMEDILTKSLTNNIEVELHPKSDLWLTEIDPGDLGDAVLNLMLNARDAMPDGGRIVVETTNFTCGQAMVDDGQGIENIVTGDYVVVSVSDNGQGMPTDVQEKIFEPFFTTKEASKGTGLGLSMVYGFAKRSRGYVRVHSEIGHGTTVRLFLPRCASSPINLPIDAPAEPALLEGHETVLIVDDESGLLDIADDMLRELGYRTLRATSGGEAIEILENPEVPTVNLLFSDVIMPGGISGFDLATWVRSNRPATAILLASGFTGRLAQRNVHQDLVHSMLHKPYDKTALARAVRRTLDGTETAMPGLARAENNREVA